MAEWSEEYRAKVREFIAKKGSPVDVQPKRYDWEEDDEANVYGWKDFQAQDHVRPLEGEGCHWVVPEGAVLYERSYSQFTDTDHDNENQMGVNVKGCHCACGRYTDVILRWTGSMQEMLHDILGLDSKRPEVTL